jgi:toxin ParE1/3/4
MARTYRIRWAEAALQDVESILAYIATRDDIACAAALYEKLIARIDTLDANPERCRVVLELRDIGITDYRELIFKPFRICFRIHDRDIVLVSILDGRRDLDQILIERALDR